MNNIIKSIAKDIEKHGGRAFFVGGCVRDSIIGLKIKDYDIEVFNIEINDLEMILNKYDEVIKIGKSFGILHLKKLNIDISLPREEYKVGDKHQDFKVSIDHKLSYKEACKRRDLTINSLLQDILTNEMHDYYGGLVDINTSTIKAVDNTTFIEDPLRILRACRFAAQLDFKIDESLIELMRLNKNILVYLSVERVFEETKKALLTNNPQHYFNYLKCCSCLDHWFVELDNLSMSELQSRLDKIKLISNTKLEASDDILIKFVIMYQNIFKTDTEAKKQLNKLILNKNLINSIVEMSNLLTKIHEYYLNKIEDWKILKLVDNYQQHIELLNKIIYIYDDTNYQLWLNNKLNIYYRFKNNLDKITGKDIILLGYKESSLMNTIMLRVKDLEYQLYNKKAIIDIIQKEF